MVMEKIKTLLLGVSAIMLIASCSKKGCTDPTALNYSEQATEDNGYCTYPNKMKILSVSVSFDDSREDGSSWDATSSPDTYVYVDDVTSSTVIYETHQYRKSETINDNSTGTHVFNLSDPMVIQLEDRVAHLRVSLYDLDDSGDGTSYAETMVVQDYNDLNWYAQGDSKFPTVINSSGNGYTITMKVEWVL